MNKTGHSEFESEVETYRDAMDSLQETADEQSRNYEGLDAAMSDLQQSVVEMGDAVDDYDHAVEEFDEAVLDLQAHATEDSAGVDASGGVNPVAGD